MIYKLDESHFEYDIKYSKRQSIQLKIEPGGFLKLSVPLNTSDKTIEDVLKKKGRWVIEKIEMLKLEFNLRQYVTGESVKFLGQHLHTTIIRRDVTRYQLSKVDKELIVVVSSDTSNEVIKGLLIDYYKQELKVVVKKRIDFYQDCFKKKPTKITVRDQKTRWGSCSSKGSLNFNYRLLMAPIDVIDYMVVHEMCHMEIMDHSKRYWNRVKEVMPDYKVYDEWLKTNARLLNFDCMEPS